MGRAKKFGKRKFFGNQHTTKVNKSANDVASDCSFASASRAKIDASFYSDCDNDSSLNQKESINVIIELPILSDLIKSCVKCKFCNQEDCVIIKPEENNRRGLSLSLLLYCVLCGNGRSTMTSSKSKKCYDLNIRLAYAMRCIGRGKISAETFCAVMNLPPPPKKFSLLNEEIGRSLAVVSSRSMIKAVEETVASTNSRDLTAAFDGTWQKRGHTSLNCVVSVTSLETGKVIDFECISKYCFYCKNNDHDSGDDHICQKTFDGYSGGMEAHGALEIFRRSESSRNVRYINYLGDGDSKAFKTVQDACVYGTDVKVSKLECIGHVQKRMGARLRSLRNNLKSQRLSDGGRISGKGRLTDNEIQHLQTYYGLAIRRNVDKPVSEMSKAVWAIYFHKLSSDAFPQHGLCPSGEDSWCGYNKALETNEGYNHKHSLPEAVLTAIKPVFRALSDKTILEKCSHGKTQNPNESFNNCIWKRLPKTIFVGINTLKVGVMDAVICFNDGAQSRLHVMQEIGIVPGRYMEKALKAIDDKRIQEAERNISSLFKNSKSKKRSLKKKTQLLECLKQTEYSAGKF